VKIYYKDNVVQAALKRTKFIYEHFGNKTFVSFSGGKDSAVCLELAHMVAEEMGLLPVNVMWLDQEAEWDMTVEYAKYVFNLPWVKPYWIQAPFVLDCSLNGHEDGLHCWNDNAIREKDPISIHNIPGSEKLVFGEMLDKIVKTFFPDGCALYGMRCEESPSRRKGLVGIKKFVGPEVWGADGQGNRRAAVIYDWSVSDVWKFINERGLEYNKLYDLQYAYGVPVFNMRVSALIHETALKSLDYAQEFESEMWNKLAERIEGINTYKHCPEAWKCPDTLPEMFKDWKEYRDFLLNKLIVEEKHYNIMRARFDSDDKRTAFLPKNTADEVYKTHVKVVLKDDYCLTAMKNLGTAGLNRYYQVLKKVTGGIL